MYDAPPLLALHHIVFVIFTFKFWQPPAQRFFFHSGNKVVDDVISTVESSKPVAVEEEEEEEGEEVVSAAAPLPASSSSSSEVAILTDDLKKKIIRQVEYYFSDENLPTDKFLIKHLKRDKAGFVPVAVVASFRKMKKLVQDKSFVVAALRESSQLILSSDGRKVKRIRPLPIFEVKDSKSCTVLVENLPEDCSKQHLQRIFGDIGRISSICIRDPHATEDSSKASKAEMAISGKIHALVEYETVKEAEKAVATLNDEKNWRSGMRVELLLKRMGKYGVAKKGWKVVASEKSDNVPASHKVGDEQNVKLLDKNDESPQQEETNHLTSEKGNRGRRNRGQGRGQFRGHKQHNGNGHGHGYAPIGSGSECFSKPPPGPKMPDGTRGFTMGRGRTPLSNQNHE
ncbi:hypothetical protein IFM89_015172 [Coptis chinensis]|uniref:La-related protein 6A n=1 Tax=Coptis chinensis TaxID=261450 RepID=A0A835GY90_9MAGN|nr:hypothetical protein IFM89_015172 [Coptis chinensis]